MAIVDKDIITLEIDNSLQRRVTATKAQQANKRRNTLDSSTTVKQTHVQIKLLSVQVKRYQSKVNQAMQAMGT